MPDKTIKLMLDMEDELYRDPMVLPVSRNQRPPTVMHEVSTPMMRGVGARSSLLELLLSQPKDVAVRGGAKFEWSAQDEQALPEHH